MHDSKTKHKQNIFIYLFFPNKHVSVAKLYSVLQYCTNYWHIALVSGSYVAAHILESYSWHGQLQNRQWSSLHLAGYPTSSHTLLCVSYVTIKCCR